MATTQTISIRKSDFKQQKMLPLVIAEHKETNERLGFFSWMDFFLWMKNTHVEEWIVSCVKEK